MNEDLERRIGAALANGPGHSEPAAGENPSSSVRACGGCGKPVSLSRTLYVRLNSDRGADVICVRCADLALRRLGFIRVAGGLEAPTGWRPRP